MSSMRSVIALLFYKKYWHEYTKEEAQSFNGLFLMLTIVFISMHPTLTAIPVRMMRGKQKTATHKQIGSLQLWIHLNQVPAFWKQGIETGSEVLHCNSFYVREKGMNRWLRIFLGTIEKPGANKKQ